MPAKTTKKSLLARPIKFVADHPAYSGYLAGCAATGFAFYVLTKNTTMLEVTADNLRLMDQGGAIVYQLKDKTLHLMNLEAVQAAQAAQAAL